jgi:exopolysaccharide biosynthesis polyprenyl glycosylphosphotransferase
VFEARQNHLAVKIVPEMFDGPGWHAPIRYVGNVPVMELLREPISAPGLVIKRAADMLSAGVGLVALAPVLALLAVAIRLDSPGAVLYSSWRIGKKGRKFRCYKLRTMVANADELKDELRDRNERDGPCFKMFNDPRVTRVGSWVRKYSLDELPQLWNVLKGEMSLVGPRPHPLDDFERYQLDHLRRLDVKPGITGLWQVYARRDPSFERNMRLDLEYIETWSLWLDAKILLKTMPVVLRGAGA